MEYFWDSTGCILDADNLVCILDAAKHDLIILFGSKAINRVKQNMLRDFIFFSKIAHPFLKMYLDSIKMYLDSICYIYIFIHTYSQTELVGSYFLTTIS